MEPEKEKEIAPGQEHGGLRSVASMLAYPFQSTRVTKEVPSPSATSEDITSEEDAHNGMQEENVEDDWILLKEKMDAVVFCSTAAAAAARDTPAEPTGAPETSRDTQRVAKQMADVQERRRYKTTSKKSKGKQPAVVASSSSSASVPPPPPPPPPPVEDPRARLLSNDSARMEILEQLRENRWRMRNGLPLDVMPHDMTTARTDVDYMSTTDAQPAQPWYSAEISLGAGPAMGYTANPSGQSDAYYLIDPELHVRRSLDQPSSARAPYQRFPPAYTHPEAYDQDQEKPQPYGPVVDESSAYHPYY